MTLRPPKQTQRERAGPALPSYLALHHAGFAVPPVSPPERWALTPPFHPCLAQPAFSRRTEGFASGQSSRPFAPAVYSLWHCPWLDEVAGLTRRHSQPPGVTRRVARGVRTFLQPGRLATTRPAITRPTRRFDYTRRCPPSQRATAPRSKWPFRSNPRLEKSELEIRQWKVGGAPLFQSEELFEGRSGGGERPCGRDGKLLEVEE